MSEISKRLAEAVAAAYERHIGNRREKTVPSAAMAADLVAAVLKDEGLRDAVVEDWAHEALRLHGCKARQQLQRALAGFTGGRTYRERKVDPDDCQAAARKVYLQRLLDMPLPQPDGCIKLRHATQAHLALAISIYRKQRDAAAEEMRRWERLRDTLDEHETVGAHYQGQEEELARVLDLPPGKGRRDAS